MDKKHLEQLEKYKEAMQPSVTLLEKTKQAMIAENNKGVGKNRRTQSMKKTWKSVGVATAAAAVIFVGGINASPAFAASLKEVPVLGQLVKVFSIHSYTKTDQDKTLSVNQPNVTGAVDLNGEIEKAVAEYTASAEKNIADYREAFLATGGTEAEFTEKNIKVSVDYEVKAETAEYLSFMLMMNEDWNGATTVTKFYNLDAKTGEAVTLEMLMGEDYMEKANAVIEKEIAAEMEKGNAVGYFEDGFTGITEDVKFFINEDNKVVIVFDKYEIAAGSAGMREFIME